MKEVVGEIRKSQLITMFGVGALVDLPHLAVIVKGLNGWSASACKEIVEPRLLSAVRAKLPSVSRIRGCPDKTSDEPEMKKIDPHGVPVSVFPRWLRCPLCNTLGTVDSGLFEPLYPPFQIDRIRFIHRGCPRANLTADRNLPGAIAARFLVGCHKGHIDDFPWLEFCHRGAPSLGHTLVLSDEGVTGEASEVQVRCTKEGCGAWRPLADAFGEKADLCIPGCSGKHPHLGRKEACSERVEALLLGASNLYFPVSVSVLAMPEKSEVTDLDAVVKQHWDRLQEVKTEADAAAVIKFGGIPDLVGQSPADLLAAVLRAQDDDTSGKLAEIRAEEYAVLSGVNSPITGDRLAAKCDERLTDELARYFEKIVLVTRLTEFTALVGFTRIESAGDLSDYDSIDPERLAPLMPPPPTWVPGAENRGEGIFLKLREDVLADWERRPTVEQRMNELQTALAAFRSERPWLRVEGPSARYVMMHTLAHALMRELSITCGYSCTSLKERIYCATADQGTPPMAGILIYTASPDSEGTLGGLVALGRSARFAPVLRSALERSRVCTSDPICAHHEIAKHSKLHGASCHSCGFLAETSCERSNRFLDRAFLIETLATSGCAYFEGRE